MANQVIKEVKNGTMNMNDEGMERKWRDKTNEVRVTFFTERTKIINCAKKAWNHILEAHIKRRREMLNAFNMLNGRMVGQAEDDVAQNKWFVGRVHYTRLTGATGLSPDIERECGGG
ncbi:hypothetical protein MTR_7g068430 [Medicago truncatula]|uniref:Uncharacterized protein n=1 Tax=Medicago truncatula TaxID=3880 RepID=A0A072U1V0_MEDTR|nr:hypothetical protein MTR_7g068430 [Medicago truncatula]